MGKEILRLVMRLLAGLAAAGIIFFIGVMLNGAVFNSNYGGGLPVIMLLFGAVAAIVALASVIRFAVRLFRALKNN